MTRATYKADYFLKDFDTIRAELIARIPIISEGKLTDLNESSIAVTLVELFASVGDMLGWYLDSSALEAFLPTVRQPENVYRHAKLIGYQIREITSAQALVRFSLSEAFTTQGNEVYVPKGTKVGSATSTASTFVTRENTVIPVGQPDSELVAVTQGIPHEEQFVSDGSADQYLTLESQAIDHSSIEVFTGDDQENRWEPQESFLYSKGTDFDCVIDTNYLGITRVVFGNGKFGRVPSVSETITVRYLVSLGVEGNVGNDAISLIFNPVYTLSGQTVSNISVTNPDPAAGGSDRQSLEHVKENAPGSLSALYRPVTKLDYIALTERIGGVLHANVWGEQEEDPPSYENMNWANIVLVPSEGGFPSENLVSIVRDYLLETQPITVRLRFLDTVYVNILADMDIYIRDGYSHEDARIEATNGVKELFALENVRFGQDLRTSAVYKIIMDITAVNHAFVSDYQVVSSTGDPVDPSSLDLEASSGQEIILNKWQIPMLYQVTVRTHAAVELPVPDLYPDESV